MPTENNTQVILEESGIDRRIIAPSPGRVEAMPSEFKTPKKGETSGGAFSAKEGSPIGKPSKGNGNGNHVLIQKVATDIDSLLADFGPFSPSQRRSRQLLR